MNDITELQKRLREQRPVSWAQLPDFALYMDQVLSYMDRQVIRFDGDDGLTAAMVNNYTKSGLAPRAEGKKYGREHLAYFTAICILKRVMSTRDMDLLIHKELEGSRSVPEGYETFCESLDQALNLTADELDQRAESGVLDDARLADTAIHFALLSYAAGVAGSRCVALLRQKETPPDPSAGKKGRGR